MTENSEVSFRERWKNQADREEKPYASIWDNNYFIVSWALTVALLAIGLISAAFCLELISLTDAGPTLLVFAGLLGVVFIECVVGFFLCAKSNIKTFREKR